jgi:hypothetical protein
MAGLGVVKAGSEARVRERDTYELSADAFAVDPPRGATVVSLVEFADRVARVA